MAESTVALCCSFATMRMSDALSDRHCDALTEYQLLWKPKLSSQSQTSPLERGRSLARRHVSRRGIRSSLIWKGQEPLDPGNEDTFLQALPHRISKEEWLKLGGSITDPSDHEVWDDLAALSPLGLMQPENGGENGPSDRGLQHVGDRLPAPCYRSVR
jgi:hypothetical protein